MILKSIQFSSNILHVFTDMFVYLVVVSKSSDIPRLSFKLPECASTEKIEDCLISQGPPVNFIVFNT